MEFGKEMLDNMSNEQIKILWEYCGQRLGLVQMCQVIEIINGEKTILGTVFDREFVTHIKELNRKASRTDFEITNTTAKNVCGKLMFVDGQEELVRTIISKVKDGKSIILTVTE